MIGKRFALLAVLAWSSQVGATDLVKDLGNASGPLQTAALQASLDKRLAAQKMVMDERVACVGMGRQRCTQMVDEDRIKGPDLSAVKSAAPAMEDARKNGRAAYDAWIIGKKPDQVAAAKKLFAAWLTQMDTIATIDDPLSASQTPSGVAYTQAVNEFQIDNPN